MGAACLTMFWIVEIDHITVDSCPMHVITPEIDRKRHIETKTSKFQIDRQCQNGYAQWIAIWEHFIVVGCLNIPINICISTIVISYIREIYNIDTSCRDERMLILRHYRHHRIANRFVFGRSVCTVEHLLFSIFRSNALINAEWMNWNIYTLFTHTHGHRCCSYRYKCLAAGGDSFVSAV